MVGRLHRVPVCDHDYDRSLWVHLAGETPRPLIPYSNVHVVSLMFNVTHHSLLEDDVSFCV